MSGGLIGVGNFTSYTIKDLVTTTVGRYEMPPLQFPEIFDESSSMRSFEMDNLTDNFTTAVAKPAGQATSYVSASQRYSTFYNHQTFALGFNVTMEAKQDLKDIEIIPTYTKQLMDAARRNQEYRGANVLNRAFDSNYIGGDGVQLCTTAHPTAIGNQANTQVVQSALSEASLEDLINLVNNFKDYNGNPANIFTKKLIVPVALQFEAARLLSSIARPATANNDLNAIRYLGKFPIDFVTNKYLTSDRRYFIKTTAENGMKHFTRMAPEISQDAAFDTAVDKVKIIFRDSFGWSQFLGIAGSGNY